MGDEAGNAWPVSHEGIEYWALSWETGLTLLDHLDSGLDCISTAEGEVSVRTHPQISDFFFKKRGNDSSG
jgi:hypothetical protein